MSSRELPEVPVFPERLASILFCFAVTGLASTGVVTVLALI